MIVTLNCLRNYLMPINGAARKSMRGGNDVILFVQMRLCWSFLWQVFAKCLVALPTPGRKALTNVKAREKKCLRAIVLKDKAVGLEVWEQSRVNCSTWRHKIFSAPANKNRRV